MQKSHRRSGFCVSVLAAVVVPYFQSSNLGELIGKFVAGFWGRQDRFGLTGLFGRSTPGAVIVAVRSVP